MDNMIFVSTDGDAIGQQVGRASLTDNLDLLAELEQKINAGNEIIAQFAESHGGQIVSSGGDEVNFTVPADAASELEMMRKDYQFAVGATLTVGFGSKLSEANKALHVAKIRGKNQTLMYAPDVEQEWLKNQEDANNGTATGEAKKIGEAYMTTKDTNDSQEQKPQANSGDDGCQMCKEYDDKNHHDNCQMCKDYDERNGISAGAPSGDDCPLCAEYDNKDHHDNCQMCKDYDAKQSAEKDIQSPDNQGDDMDSIDNCPECQKLLTGGSDGSDQEVGDIEPGTETKEEILNAIDTAPPAGQTPEQMAQNIDDTQLPQGNAADGNRSVTENFGPAQETNNANQPGQNAQQDQGGDTTNSPSMGGVIQDGLNDNADEIQKEKVRNMVGEALTSFKNQKQVLEQIQGQAPEFYTANIQMLRCMIELCKMMGLEPKRDQASYTAPSQPSAPAQPAAPAEGAAQAPQ